MNRMASGRLDASTTIERPLERRPGKIEYDARRPEFTARSPAPPPLCSRDGRPVNVVHIVAELAPFARTGGLGEAVASLAHYQSRAGFSTSIVMPLYGTARNSIGDLKPVGPPFRVQVGPRSERACLYEAIRPRRRAPSEHGVVGPRVFFIESSEYFDRPGIYGENGADYDDNARRYAFFAAAAVAALPQIASPPLILHAHDWHTALAPVYLRTQFAKHPYYRQVNTVLTVHNAGYQGHFAPDVMSDLGLPMELYNWRQLEWYDRVNLLKGGLAFSDIVTTVSSTHAHELRTAAGGFGLDGMFVSLRDRFIGILNGIDQHIWDPATDPSITCNFTTSTLECRRKCRQALQRTFGLQLRPRTPIFAMTARLVAQKGLDLILGDPGYFALDAQFVFLGNGEPRYAAALKEIASRAPTRIAVQLEFSERLEHRLLAGADMCLMPSLYEPCGLTQMRAQRYGTIPVARRVGGLADTIEDGITGFLFDDYTTEDFMRAAVRAVDHYNDPEGWRAMMRDAMSRDFGWEKSEARYRQAYRKVVSGRTMTEARTA
jgi:starch synthase